MNAKERVLNKLVSMTMDGEWVSAKSIADILKLSRQNVSHYLNQLLTDGKVSRKSGRPVLWQITNSSSEKNNKKNIFRTYDYGSFANVIGYGGSLRESIIKCISAVNYPDGLSILLKGPSGVGKSFIAHKIFDYAREHHVIGTNAPFIILNCADYADNPELLSATLFGYKRGSFTGATQDKDGLLSSANGGYLFLDEVHRLSSENQEKLFLFMDSGKYRPIGENNNWSQSKIRFIFATTEDTDKVFLDTFKRRIEVIVQLPAFHERPISERIALIEHFFNVESHKLQRKLIISGNALEVLATAHDAGNVGHVKNVIKLVCANAFSQNNAPILHIDSRSLAIELGSQLYKTESKMGSLIVDWKQPRLTTIPVYNLISMDCESLIKYILQQKPINQLETVVQRLIKKVRTSNILTHAQIAFSRLCLTKWQQIVVKKYGIIQAKYLGATLSEMAVYNIDIPNDIEKALRKITQRFPRSAYVAQKYVQSLNGISELNKELLQILTTITLVGTVQEKMPLKGLLIAHGEGTASSIQSVVNQLCGNYIFEAIDMSIDSSIEQIVRIVQQFISKEVKTDSLVLLVDMGSLNQLYKQLKNDLEGELLILDNLTTAVALDIGLKIQNQVAFDRIAEDAVANYKINIQYFEGFARKENIIISCMSGFGISEQLSHIFSKYLAGNNLEIFTRDYRTIRRLIDQNDSNYFRKTRMVITTSSLPHTFDIPNINIYDILDTKGSQKLESLLDDELSPSQFQAMMQELIRFLSLEGVADRLNFLNPKMVIGEVETVVSKYENIFKIHFTGKVKLNLYMHISLMMERLFISRTDTDNSNSSVFRPKPEEEEFFCVSHSIFQSMEMKYHFKVNDYEISLLYEIIGLFITE